MSKVFSPCHDTRIFCSIHIKAYAAFRFRFKILSTKIVPLKIKRLDFFVLNICSVFICEGLKVFSTANHFFSSINGNNMSAIKFQVAQCRRYIVFIETLYRFSVYLVIVKQMEEKSEQKQSMSRVLCFFSFVSLISINTFRNRLCSSMAFVEEKRKQLTQRSIFHSLFMSRVKKRPLWRVYPTSKKRLSLILNHVGNHRMVFCHLVAVNSSLKNSYPI